MATRSVATVFGGSGFIGRYVVKRLAHKGFVVRVAVRDPERALFLKPMGAVGQVVPLYASVTDEATVHRAVDGAELVVNLVGILAERRSGDFQRMHAEGAGPRGASGGRLPAWRGWCTSRRSVPIRHAASRYAASKAAGEQAVRDGFPAPRSCGRRWCSARRTSCSTASPRMARMLPVMPVICGDTRFQPVYVGDVADAVMAALGASGRRRRRLRTRRAARLAVPRAARLRSAADRAASADGRHADGAGAVAGEHHGAAARQAADARPVADAAA